MADVDNAGASYFVTLIAAVWDWLEKFVSAFWVGLGWPHAALAIFCVTAFFFKKELREFIPRITEVGAAGVRLSDAVVQNQQKASADSDVVPNFESAMNLGSEFAALMKLTTASVDAELGRITDPDKRISFLREYLSYWRAMYIFENFYSTIFGGQIRILKLINPFGSSIGCTKEQVRDLWESLVQLNKPLMDGWQLESYLKFIFDYGLAEDRNDSIAITELGREFLMWMTKHGKMDNKPL